MKSLLIPLLLLLSTTDAWRFVSKVEELPVDETDRLEVIRPKVRLCGGDSGEESTDCVLCTVCHPHEYELIGCSGQMDSVCASCTTGWMRTTPKTVDFFRKCKKHPQLPFIFPDVPYGYKLKVGPPPVKNSMFADQEKMLQEAENTESAEMDDELSEEDYDAEEEEEEPRLEKPIDYTQKKYPLDTMEWEEVDGDFHAVLVDEDDEESGEANVSGEVDIEDDTEYEQKFHNDLEKMIAEKFKILGLSPIREKVDNESLEEEDSMEVMDVKEEERSDPFDSKTEKKEELEAEKEEEDESEELEHRVYPLHKVNIWRIIGPEKMKIDDKDISDEIREAINERTDQWRLTKGLDKQRFRVANAENPRTVGGYRPMPMREKYRPYGAELQPMEWLAWAFCFFLLCAIVVVCFKICLIRRRNRVIVLPELDEISRQLINEAHARVHAKENRKAWPKPEFV